MRHLLTPMFLLCSLFLPTLPAQTQSSPAASRAALRVGIVGLVHGHVDGFFHDSLHNPEIQIAGIAESNQQLFLRYAKQYGLDRSLLFPSLEEMLQKVHPQAVLVYTNTYDHRHVVEACARQGVHVMMEKPLAVNLEDARAIQQAAKQGKIQVVVNYETTWYRSNRAAYDLVRQNGLGDIRKLVIHDGHTGPQEITVAHEFLASLTDPKLHDHS